MPIGLFGVPRVVALPVVGLVAVLLGVVAWVVVDRDAGVSPSPHGAVATVADLPAVLDAPTMVSSINQVRSSMSEQALTRDACLDSAAAEFAKSISNGPASAYPTGPQVLCGSASAVAGWVVGIDPSGVQMVSATVMRVGDGSAGVTSVSSKRIGLDLVQRRSGAGVIGYLLVWVVAG